MTKREEFENTNKFEKVREKYTKEDWDKVKEAGFKELNKTPTKEEELKSCINCGKKGFFVTKNCFLKGKTHKCKYCGMEFNKVKHKGVICWKGDIPKFNI